jgi:CubicO group peptidase (beta-lactamase class C family)
MNAHLLLRKGLLVLLLAAAVLALSALAPASPANAGPREPGSLRPTGLDPAEMEALWDPFFEREMADYSVPGAVMVAVRGNEVLFSNGYGYANLAGQAPMDPQTTILRAGSIAKTLTATAVFQLAEQGRLDLDADINSYLTRFKIPATFPEPVTTRQLVNMTAGFDTRAIGIRAASLGEIIPLEDYLAERMPPRVLPPGRYRRYNDHEIALAGYLVQVVSGMPYEQYVRTHIFEPLEMNDSSVYLPDDLLPRAARGYPVGGGAQDPYPLNYYYLNTAPGAGFNTTATDMARYMSAHIQLGSYQRGDGSTGRILARDTALEMQANGFSHHPLLAGQANTFDEMFYEGQRYLRKLGGAPGMQNNLVLLPSEGLAFYLFTNTDGYGLRNEWARKVIETYLSEAGASPVRTSRSQADNASISPENYTGFYRQVSDQTSQTTIVQVQALVNPDSWLQVEANPGGSLQIGGQTYTPVDPLLFENSSGGYTAFELDEAGGATFLFQARTPYERVSWIVTPEAQLGIFGFSLLAFLAVAVVFAVSLLRRRASGLALAGLAAALYLAFVIGLAIVMLPVATGGDIWQFSLEPSLALRSLLAIPLATTLLALALLVKTLIDWRRSRSKPGALLVNALALAGMLAFVTFLNTWNLLGWRF